MGKQTSASGEAKKAVHGIVLQPNVYKAAVASGGNPYVVGGVLAANAGKYGLAHMPKSISVGGQTVSTKHAVEGVNRVLDYSNGKRDNILNKGDYKIAAKMGADYIANNAFKGAQRRGAQQAVGIVNRVAKGGPLLTAHEGKKGGATAGAYLGGKIATATGLGSAAKGAKVGSTVGKMIGGAAAKAAKKIKLF